MMTPVEESEFERLCCAIGFMTITWAWGENALGLAITIIDGTGTEIRGHVGLPVSLRKRLDYLKIALRDMPALESLKEEGASLIKLFKDLKVRRGELVHGSAAHMSDGGLQSFTLQAKGRQQSIKQEPIEITSLAPFIGEVRGLADAANLFMMRVSELLPE